MQIRDCTLGGAALALLAFAATAAGAHTGYIRPNFFTGAKIEYVTAQASFTEDFSQPEIAIESPNWSVIKPDGSRTDFTKVTSFKQVTILESELKEPGTYRLTSGVRLGRTGTQIYDKETKTWKGLERGATAPAGAKTRQSQTETVSDVYVTKGAPTQPAIDTVVGRLAIKPVTHPSSIFLDSGFDLIVTFDGKPVKQQKLVLEREGGSYEEPKYEQTFETDANGKLSLKFDKPGAYLLMTRMVADAPKGSETPVRSYTTSLTFEVMR